MQALVSASKSLAMSAPPTRWPIIQRACTCDGDESDCEECKQQSLQRSLAAGPAGATAPESVAQVLSTSGRPLDADTRGFFEPRFGHDFGAVRIHADRLASESAAAVNARAYTVGNHVVFRTSEYRPATSDGRRLLAHELAHTLQQNSTFRLAAAPARLSTLRLSFREQSESADEEHPMPGAGSIQAKLEVSEPGDADEEEADRIADLVMGMADLETRPMTAGSSLPRIESERGRFKRAT